MSYALIFDMDGVIVDSNPAHKAAIDKFCAMHQVQLNETQMRQHIYGRTNKDWLTYLFGPLSSARLNALAHQKEAIYRQMYVRQIAPLAGLRSFLQAAQTANIPLVIATSAPPENVEFVLSNTSLSCFFQHIVDETQVTKGKPSPEVFIKAAQHTGVAPSRCIVFEDSLSGVAAAQAANCKVVAVATTHQHSELAHADVVIDNFVDLTLKEVVQKTDLV